MIGQLIYPGMAVLGTLRNNPHAFDRVHQYSDGYGWTHQDRQNAMLQMAASEGHLKNGTLNVQVCASLQAIFGYATSNLEDQRNIADGRSAAQNFMAYNYQTERPFIFTEEGQEAFLRVRDNVARLLNSAGAVRMQEAIEPARVSNSWAALAIIDRMVELKEIIEIGADEKPAGQYRVFIRHPHRES